MDSVTLPGSEGQIEILEGHAPTVGTLDTGVFSYHVSGAAHSGVISSGFFEICDNNVTVLAETLELRGEIDVERARRAQKLAEDNLKAADLDPHHFGKYQLKLQRSLIRQQVAGKE